MTSGTASVSPPHHSEPGADEVGPVRAEVCRDRLVSNAPIRANCAQHALPRGAKCKPVLLVSLGLENFESGQWSSNKSRDVQGCCAKFGGEGRLSYDFACK